MSKQLADIQTICANNSAGFTILELVVLVTLIGIVSSIAFVSIQKSNKSLNVAGATRTFSAYLEKARLDSIRRHGAASVVIDSTSSYTVNIDFNGTGTTIARTITLPAGTSLSYTLPPATTSINPSTTPITIAYDWRGKSTNTVVLTLTDSTAGVTPSTLVAGPAGDISVDTTVTGPVTTPTPRNTTVTTTTGIKTMR